MYIYVFHEIIGVGVFFNFSRSLWMQYLLILRIRNHGFGFVCNIIILY